jgi:putative protease
LTPIELLAPAKNPDYGKTAVLHGADAVYIGAARFGARAGAANATAGIENLVRFAHLYRAKVYVAINTILYDNEMEDALRLIRQLYEAGVDALIIQDMGLLQCDLPPVPLFASTQTHNISLEKIRFLEKTGFKRVILARELSLDEIRNIRRHTAIDLECFVHGALCVSYSGQCYMSHALTGRSGNRGVCAQPCRSAYRLLDANRHTLVDNAYLLSLKDLNLSGYLLQLMQAGVTSFKIEGRLKDLNYVKNVTAFYRKRLDELMEHDGDFTQASSGKTTFHFTPNLKKTFHRGYSAYFIEGRQKAASPETQKATGEQLGIVTQVHPEFFVITTQYAINKGDGLCWLHPQRGLEGVLVNNVQGNKVFPAKKVNVSEGMVIFRNNDSAFERQLAANSSDRRIAVSFELCEHRLGYRITVTDEDGNTAEYIAETDKIPAKDAENARAQIIKQLCKLGHTAFSMSAAALTLSSGYFIPAAVVNKMRREAIIRLETLRIDRYHASETKRTEQNVPFPKAPVDYRINVANRYAKAFYEKHGVTITENAFELQNEYSGKTLMISKHCIRYQYDACPHRQTVRKKWQKSLFLQDNRHIYRLEFDCKECVMKCILT